MYAQMTCADSTVGYDVTCTFSWKRLPGTSEGMSTQLPSTSNFQPW